jgi:serine acetyltransferase
MQHDSQARAGGGYISCRAEIGERVRISPSARLFGHVIVGDDTVIDANVTLGYPSVDAIRACLGSGTSTTEELLDQAAQRTTVIGRDSLIRGFTVIYEDVNIGEKLDCAHDVVVREGSLLGVGVELGPQAYVKSDAKIGDYCRIAGVICDRAIVGNHCTVYGDVVHKFTSGISGVKEDSPTLEDGVVIGRQACVVGPVTIGRLSLIGAGAIVTHSVPEESVVAGNPAQSLRSREWAEAAELWARVLGADVPR